MYKLILVDDETEIREGFKEVIPFEALGFTLAGEAANGVEALQLCEQTEPDLLVTDIRMPLMDGLTLCRRAQALLPTLQCVILSGYDDFEYAQQAIEIHTMGYLLKPIASGEFIEMLEKAKQTLDEAFKSRADVSRLQAHFRESLPLLKETLLGSLLAGTQAPASALERAPKYGLQLESPWYAAALYRLDDRPAASAIEDGELRLLAAHNILNEVLNADPQMGRAEVFAYGGMIAALLLLKDHTDSYFAAWVARLDEACKTLRHYLDCAAYAGVSAPCAQLSRLPAAARQAATALNQCVLDMEDQALLITDIEGRRGGGLTADDASLTALENGVKARDQAMAQAALRELMNAARGGDLTPRAWQAYLMEIFMRFLRTLSEQSLTEEGLNERLDALLSRILRACPSVDEAEAELSALLEAFLTAMESNRLTAARQLAAEAERYLQQHYAREDTSLEELCLHLHISPSYFSMIFKKETKKTFHQYLTDLRMDKALTLLSTGDLKISQIAQSVGLPDPSYFSYCFKKHFGYPPSRTRSH